MDTLCSHRPAYCHPSRLSGLCNRCQHQWHESGLRSGCCQDRFLLHTPASLAESFREFRLLSPLTVLVCEEAFWFFPKTFQKILR